MKKLTITEELEYLKKAQELDKYLDHGSSRVVFQISEDKVLKVAIDEEGQFQNDVERELFADHGKEHLAEIYAFGSHVLVQELVEIPLSFKDVVCEYNYTINAGDYDIEEDFEYCGYTEDMITQGLHVEVFLEEVLGFSEDNQQLGIRRGTETVISYDYGYMSDCHDISVSRTLKAFITESNNDFQEVLFHVSNLVHDRYYNDPY